MKKNKPRVQPKLKTRGTGRGRLFPESAEVALLQEAGPGSPPLLGGGGTELFWVRADPDEIVLPLPLGARGGVVERRHPLMGVGVPPEQIPRHIAGVLVGAAHGTHDDELEPLRERLQLLWPGVVALLPRFRTGEARVHLGAGFPIEEGPRVSQADPLDPGPRRAVLLANGEEVAVVEDAIGVFSAVPGNPFVPIREAQVVRPRPSPEVLLRRAQAEAELLPKEAIDLDHLAIGEALGLGRFGRGRPRGTLSWEEEGAHAEPPLHPVGGRHHDIGELRAAPLTPENDLPLRGGHESHARDGAGRLHRLLGGESLPL